LEEGLLVFKGNAHKSESVLDKVFLYHEVEGSAGLKRGGMIDLYNNRLEIVHNHNIKAKDMEAHISLILLGLAIRILMSDGGQATYYCLDNTFLNLFLKLIDINAILSQPFINPFERTFMPHVHLLVTLVINVVGVALIEGVICKVNEVLVQVLGGRGLVGTGSQPGQALLVNVQAERVTASQQNVDS
jgi:hypothetical protein